MRTLPATHPPLISIICALVLCVAPARGQDTIDDSTALRGYFTGNGLLNREMYELAVPEYRRFLDDYADHEKAPVARYGLAVSLFRLARYDEAVVELKQLRPRAEFAYAAEVLTILGQCQLARGQFDGAAECFGDVVREHAGHDLADDAAALSAESLYRAGRFEQVEGPCEVLATRWPQSPLRERAELFWGLSDMARGDYAHGARRFEAMSGRYPDGAYADQTALLLGQCLHRSNAWRNAMAQYRKVIERARDEYVPDAMYGLALLLHGRDRPEPAGRLLDELLARFPEDERVAEARLLRGRAWFDLEAYDRAFEQFERLSTVRGDLRDDAVYWMAKCRLRQDRAADAAERFREALRRFPESELRGEMTYDRAVALLRAGDADGALRVLDGFRSTFGQHALMPDAVQMMAATHHQERRYRESLELCRKFQADYPDHPEFAPAVAFLAAENTYLMKEYGRAAAAYRSLLERYPEHEQADQARYRLGMALYYGQAFDKADEVLVLVADGRQTEPAFRGSLLGLGDGHFQRSQWAPAERHLGDYVFFGLDQPSADDALLKLGIARQRQGGSHGALKAFERLIEDLPESPHRLHAMFERGQVLVTLGRTDEARSALEQVLAEGADSRFAAHALNHLGTLAVERGDYPDAAAYFGRAAEAFPAHPEAGVADLAAEAIFQQGQALMSAQQFEPAAEVLSRLEAEHPSHARRPQASALRAIALARRGGRRGHAEALIEIQRVEQEHAGALDASLRTALAYEKAWCLRELDRAADAAGAYRAVLAEPRHGEVYDHALLELAELEIEAERYKAAAELLLELRRLIEGGAEVAGELRSQCTYRLGLCEFRLGNYPSAAALLEEFLAADANGALATSAGLLCAEALVKMGRYERGATHLARVVARFESESTSASNEEARQAYGTSLLRLSECLAALQQWPESEAVFARYLDRFPRAELRFQAHFGVGWARENQGRHDDAMEAYGKVIDRHQGPTAARAQFQVGECLFAQKRFDEAVRAYLKVDILYAYPQWSAAALYEAGRCFGEMGNPVEARAQYEQVQRDHEQTRWAKLAGERLAELGRSTLPGHRADPPPTPHAPGDSLWESNRWN